MQKLTERDKRTIKLGALCAVGIVMFYFGSKWHEKWSDARAGAKMKQAQIESLNMSNARRAGILSIVPAFEMPQKELRKVPGAVEEGGHQARTAESYDIRKDDVVQEL